MRKFSYLKWALALAILMGGWQTVFATTVKTFAFEGICETAQTIVHVKCLDRQSVTFDDREGIYTQTRFEVLEVVKGQAETEVVLVLPGGKVDGRRMSVPGVPQFVPGEETVLFLSEPDDFGSPWPVGLGQGCYGVQLQEGEHRQVSLKAAHTPLPPGVRSKPVVDRQMALRDFVSAVQSVIQVPQRVSDPTQ